MDRITIREILRGLTPGRIQSVGLMQVVPLTGRRSDDRFACPTEAEVGTSGYGEMSFRNPSDKILLVPSHAAYVVKQAAQDHAMSTAGMVRGNRTGNFDTACCIQETQGGYIRAGQHQMFILPVSLR